MWPELFWPKGGCLVADGELILRVMPKAEIKGERFRLTTDCLQIIELCLPES